MFLAMFAILLQALPPPGQALAWERADDRLPDVLIICTAWGARAIAAERAIAPSPDSPAGKAGGKFAGSACPVCAAQALNAPMPTAEKLPPPVSRGGVLVHRSAAVSFATSSPDARRRIIRAPPAGL